MKRSWRLILDGKHDGYYNMAVDEAILLNYSKERKPTLRIYGWKYPFITLGYNQIPEHVLKAASKIPFVRRITGGAAILHHEELTYSLICAVSDINLPQKVKESFKHLSSFLVEFYSQLGLEAGFAQDFLSGTLSENMGRLGEYGNFCFSSCEHYDLLIEGKKIGGNAQKRRKGIIFQQGSIPQAVDVDLVSRNIRNVEKINTKITYLNELLKISISFAELQVLLSKSFQQTFDLELQKGKLTDQEESLAKILANNKYEDEHWNIKRQARNIDSNCFSVRS